MKRNFEYKKAWNVFSRALFSNRERKSSAGSFL